MGFPTRMRCDNCGGNLEDSPTWFTVTKDEVIEGRLCSYKCVEEWAAFEARKQAGA